jgi:hypothetical protein
VPHRREACSTDEHRHSCLSVLCHIDAKRVAQTLLSVPPGFFAVFAAQGDTLRRGYRVACAARPARPGPSATLRMTLQRM